MDFLSQYALFLAKTVTVVLGVLVTVGGSIALAARGRSRAKDRIQVTRLNLQYEEAEATLQASMLPKKALHRVQKARKRRHKEQRKSGAAERRRIFVLNFHGNILATAVASLREEITAVLTVATPKDEILLRLESSGGVVHGYGLAASQLQRLKAHGVPLTAAVDKVAASGGYMMACIADRVLAAPFAIVGSIGVVSQLPNFNRLLKKNEVDYELITAGEYKRTLTLFGENTEKGRQKAREEVEEAHHLFKDFVKAHRPQLDMDMVATGEHWYGARALELKLVDELRTSDDYLLGASRTADLYEVRYTPKKALAQRLLGPAEQGILDSLRKGAMPGWV
jgi:serine protease SohB